MSIPTPVNVRSLLEGYGVTTSIISDAWINTDLNGMVIPEWENKTGMALTVETEYTEYLSGNGYGLLFLSRKNINSIVSAEYLGGSPDIDNSLSLANIKLIADRGMIEKVNDNVTPGSSSSFYKGTKNIKIVYLAGGTCPDDVSYALTMWSAVNVLAIIGNRTGGGSLGVKDFNRQYGDLGKYTNIRLSLKNQVRTIMNKYSTGVSQS